MPRQTTSVPARPYRPCGDLARTKCTAITPPRRDGTPIRRAVPPEHRLGDRLWTCPRSGHSANEAACATPWRCPDGMRRREPRARWLSKLYTAPRSQCSLNAIPGGRQLLRQHAPHQPLGAIAQSDPAACGRGSSARHAATAANRRAMRAYFAEGSFARVIVVAKRSSLGLPAATRRARSRAQACGRSRARPMKAVPRSEA